MTELPTTFGTLPHAAAVAWSVLSGADGLPCRVEILKDRRDSRVYRLPGAGPGGTNVIAKYYPTRAAVAEQRIYIRVLPRLPFRSLRHYGLVNSDDGFCWGFLEDAGTARYSPDLKEHRRLATEWLALLHTTADGVGRELELPDRGSAHYRDCLETGRNRIVDSLATPRLGERGRRLLTSILRQYDAVEQLWPRIWLSCGAMTPTFVHADFHNANISIARDGDGSVLLAFDWESAGVGPPAIDLSLPGIDVAGYASLVERQWPGLEPGFAPRMVIIGRLFQLFELIDWESRSLSGEWLHRPLKHMTIYEACLAAAVAEAWAL